jgi:hypothetical protein
MIFLLDNAALRLCWQLVPHRQLGAASLPEHSDNIISQLFLQPPPPASAPPLLVLSVVAELETANDVVWKSSQRIRRGDNLSILNLS